MSPTCLSEYHQHNTSAYATGKLSLSLYQSGRILSTYLMDNKHPTAIFSRLKPNSIQNLNYARFKPAIFRCDWYPLKTCFYVNSIHEYNFEGNDCHHPVPRARKGQHSTTLTQASSKFARHPRLTRASTKATTRAFCVQATG